MRYVRFTRPSTLVKSCNLHPTSSRYSCAHRQKPKLSSLCNHFFRFVLVLPDPESCSFFASLLVGHSFLWLSLLFDAGRVLASLLYVLFYTVLYYLTSVFLCPPKSLMAAQFFPTT